jgi:Zn-dependent protease
MFATYSLGTLSGVEVRLHGSVFLLAIVLGLSSLLGSGLGAAVGTVAILAAVLGCVTLHELGHIAMARAFGTHTSGITLYPFGGVASLTRPAASGTEEVLVALAGPAVNLGLAAVAGIPMLFLGPIEPLLTLCMVNVGLLLFNLIPAYPMDGGRVLRGALWAFLGERRATWWAARVGQVLSVGLGLGGLYLGAPMLAVVAFVVFMQATGELRRLGAGRTYVASRSVEGVLDPAPFTAARDPFRPAQQRHVRMHTASGTWQQWTLPDGRVVRRLVSSVD